MGMTKLDHKTGDNFMNKVVTNAAMFESYFGISPSEITEDFWNKEFEFPRFKKDDYAARIAFKEAHE